MKKSVEEYLTFCRERGRDPEKPFSGNITIRTNPELHRRVAHRAVQQRLSMNAFIQEALEKAVSDS